MRIRSGVAATDAFLDNGYTRVRGMSSRFAAAVCARLIAVQRKAGIKGGIAEIGAFQGRFFIALMKALEKGERGVAIDQFSWPDDSCLARFEANCARYGLKPERFTALKADSRRLKPEAITGPLEHDAEKWNPVFGKNHAKFKRLEQDDDSRKRHPGLGGKARFIHVDGEHTPEHLTSDLALALAAMSDDGIMVLDDMLHPGYPLLGLTVQAFLEKHPGLRVCCIIDREDIVGAAKFVICRAPRADFYFRALEKAFKPYHWPMTADFRAYQAMVLTPKPRLARIA